MYEPHCVNLLPSQNIHTKGFHFVHLPFHLVCRLYIGYHPKDDGPDHRSIIPRMMDQNIGKCEGVSEITDDVMHGNVSDKIQTTAVLPNNNTEDY